MKLFSSRIAPGASCLGLLAAAVGAVAPSATLAAVNTSQCVTPEYSQPFAYVGDDNWYTLPAGESYDNFAGAGWQLSGGARIVSETLADGARGDVLDLPSGSRAVSPVICVTSAYPTARAIVRNVKGLEG